MVKQQPTSKVHWKEKIRKKLTFIYCASFYVYSSIQNSITNLRRMSIIHHLLKTFIQIDIQDLSPSRKTLMISLSFFPFLFPFLVALSNFAIFCQVLFEKSSDNNLLRQIYHLTSIGILLLYYSIFRQSFLCQFQLYTRRIVIQLMKHIELSRLFIYSGIKVSREIPKPCIHSFNVCRYSCKEVYEYGGLVEKIVSFFDLVR